MLNMSMSKPGLIDLADHEGICQYKYWDSVSVQTIGIGFTVTEIPDIKNWPWDKSMSLVDIFKLFKVAIQKYEYAINKALTRQVEQHVFDALVSWCYNVGTGRPPKATIIRLLNEGEKDKNRLFHALMMWDIPPEIKSRRTKEAVLLTQGKYYSNGKVNVFPTNSKHKPLYGQGKLIDVGQYL